MMAKWWRIAPDFPAAVRKKILRKKTEETEKEGADVVATDTYFGQDSVFRFIATDEYVAENTDSAPRIAADLPADTGPGVGERPPRLSMAADAHVIGVPPLSMAADGQVIGAFPVMMAQGLCHLIPSPRTLNVPQLLLPSRPRSSVG